MIDLPAVAILSFLFLLGAVFWKWGSSFQVPHLKFSQLQPLIEGPLSLKQKYAKLPRYLLIAAGFFFSTAFLDPHYFVEKAPEVKKETPLQQVSIPSEGIAIYLVLDQSGSMSEEVKVFRKTITKMDLLKEVTKGFVLGNKQEGLTGRPQDMMGLVTFARGAQVLAPLTLDHQAIIDQLNKLQYTTDLEQDGTAIGYAIYKTANLIAATRHYAEELEGAGKPAYTIKNSIMILVTDGLQAPNPLDQGKEFRNVELLDAAVYAKKLGVKVYIINVEPRIASEEFSAHRLLMKKITELTGGRFYMVDNSLNLSSIYSEIDQLEKSPLPLETQYISPPKSMQPQLYRRVSFYPYLVAAGMLCFLLSIVLETRVFRRVP